MDRYRVAPTRPVFLSNVGQNAYRLPPSGSAAAGRRSGGPELDIFSAERYFNAVDVGRGSSSVGAPAAVHAANEPPEQLVAVDATSQSGRTAASSEASWNSRSWLLPRDQSAWTDRQQRDKGCGGGGAVSTAGASDLYHRRGRKAGSRQRWGLFSRDCPCAGRKAVTVDVASEPPSPTTARVHTRHDDGGPAMEDSTILKAEGLPSPTPIREPPAKMKIAPSTGAFPLRANSNSILAPAPSNGGGASFATFRPDVGHRIVSSGGFTFPVLGAGRVVVSTVEEEPPRESLEVFRPIDEDSVVLRTDPPPPALAPAVVVSAGMDGEAMSDASSDLFDLESFAASSSYPTTYRGRSSRRNSVDDDMAYAAAAEPALSECMYAPSEASVVWSVATAEGFAYDAASAANFSSAASACCVDEFRFVPPVAGAGHDGFTAVMSRSAGRKKGGGGFLNSCRCEKAVSVGPTPVRVVRPPSTQPRPATATGAERKSSPAGRHILVKSAHIYA